MKKKYIVIFTGLILWTMAASPSFGWESRSQQRMRRLELIQPDSAGQLPSNVVYCFFREAFTPGGFQYAYPERSKVIIAEGVSKNGEVSLRFDLIPTDYSGGSVCLYNMLFDLKPYLKNGALEFWIKGETGNEVGWIALVDDEKGDLRKTVVRRPSFLCGGIHKEWTRMTIPLSHFGYEGVYYDSKKRLEIPNAFDWDKVAEFRVEVKKDFNKSFRVWVDDIFIVKSVEEQKN